MIKPTNREKIIDLTSLLDVVLILLFGLLVTMSVEKEEAKKEISQLQNDLYEAQVHVNHLVDEQDFLQTEFSQIFESEDPIKQLKQLEFFSQQFFVIDVRVNTQEGHEIIINQEKAGIFLPLSIRNSQVAKDQVRKKLYRHIEDLIDTHSTQEAYVLLSLEDQGGTYNFAFDLIWNVFMEIEEREGGEKIHKMQHIRY